MQWVKYLYSPEIHWLLDLSVIIRDPILLHIDWGVEDLCSLLLPEPVDNGPGIGLPSFLLLVDLLLLL